MSETHMRHLPQVIRDIQDLDTEILRLRGPKDLDEARNLRDLRKRRDEKRAEAHKIYGRQIRGSESSGR